MGRSGGGAGGAAKGSPRRQGECTPAGVARRARGAKAFLLCSGSGTWETGRRAAGAGENWENGCNLGAGAPSADRGSGRARLWRPREAKGVQGRSEVPGTPRAAEGGRGPREPRAHVLRERSRRSAGCGGWGCRVSGRRAGALSLCGPAPRALPTLGPGKAGRRLTAAPSGRCETQHPWRPLTTRRGRGVRLAAAGNRVPPRPRPASREWRSRDLAPPPLLQN